MDQLDYIISVYPWIQHVLAVLVISRLVFKPLFLILEKYVSLTVEEDDNIKLKKFMKTKTYKMLAFIVDLTVSVKLPKVKGR